MNDNDDTLRAINSIEHFARALLKQPNSMATATGTQMIADAILTNVAVLRSRASVAAVEGEWQPIATVPKNGDEVLLAHANSQWLDQWISDITGDYAEGGYWMMCDQWTDPETPTHWKPLSALPNPAAVSSPAPAEPPHERCEVPDCLICAAYGPAEPLQPEGEQETQS